MPKTIQSSFADYVNSSLKNEIFDVQIQTIYKLRLGPVGL